MVFCCFHVINPLVLLIFNSKKVLGTPGLKQLFKI